MCTVNEYLWHEYWWHELQLKLYIGLNNFLVTGIQCTFYRSFYLGEKCIFVQIFMPKHLTHQAIPLFTPRSSSPCQRGNVLALACDPPAARPKPNRRRREADAHEAPLGPRVPPFAWGFHISRSLRRAPRSAHLWCHSKEGLFFCRLLPRNLLHHHGNSLICRPRAFPLQQWNQQWRESAAGLATTASHKHTPEPSSL